MRWKLCKIFKVKPSDDLITGMTIPELAWMYTMILQDEKEEYEQELNMTEYLASFSNPEAVQQVKSNRKNLKTMSDGEFATLVSSISGRAAPNIKAVNG